MNSISNIDDERLYVRPAILNTRWFQNENFLGSLPIHRLPIRKVVYKPKFVYVGNPISKDQYNLRKKAWQKSKAYKIAVDAAKANTRHKGYEPVARTGGITGSPGRTEGLVRHKVMPGVSIAVKGARPRNPWRAMTVEEMKEIKPSSLYEKNRKDVYKKAGLERKGKAAVKNTLRERQSKFPNVDWENKKLTNRHRGGEFDGFLPTPPRGGKRKRKVTSDGVAALTKSNDIISPPTKRSKDSSYASVYTVNDSELNVILDDVEQHMNSGDVSSNVLLGMLESIANSSVNSTNFVSARGTPSTVYDSARGTPSTVYHTVGSSTLQDSSISNISKHTSPRPGVGEFNVSEVLKRQSRNANLISEKERLEALKHVPILNTGAGSAAVAAKAAKVVAKLEEKIAKERAANINRGLQYASRVTRDLKHGARNIAIQRNRLKFR